jgi:transposase
MELSTLLGLPDGLHLLGVTVLSAAVVVEVCACHVTSPCPRCSTASDRVHSYYPRTVADVPCASRPVRITLRVRKFRGADSACPQKVFTERFPAELCPWARKTMRLVEALTALGLAIGGRGTELVAPAMGMPVSHQTVLRLLARGADPQ